MRSTSCEYTELPNQSRPANLDLSGTIAKLMQLANARWQAMRYLLAAAWSTQDLCLWMKQPAPCIAAVVLKVFLLHFPDMAAISSRLALSARLPGLDGAS